MDPGLSNSSLFTSWGTAGFEFVKNGQTLGSKEKSIIPKAVGKEGKGTKKRKTVSNCSLHV